MELAKEVAKYNGLYATHMRSESSSITEAIDEALTIGLQAGIPVEISHFKIVAPKLHGRSDMTLGMVEKAREAGQDVTVDQVRLHGVQHRPGSILPDWAAEGTSEAVKARLTDPATRKRIIDELVTERRDQQGRKDMAYAFVANFHADKSLNGKNLLEITKLRTNDDSWEAQIGTALDMISAAARRWCSTPSTSETFSAFSSTPTICSPPTRA